MSSARRIRRAGLAPALFAVLAASVLASPARAASPVAEQVRISQSGADGDAARSANNPSAAFNPTAGLAQRRPAG